MRVAPIALLSLLFAQLLASGAGLASPPNALETPANLLRYVDATDGISEAEANDIAQAYFLIHVGCGAYTGIADGTDAWVVEGQFGYSGLRIENFLIDKRTGAISSSVGPSYEHPVDMLHVGDQPEA